MASEWVELTSVDGGGKISVNLANADTIQHFTGYTSISFGAGGGTVNVRESPSEILRGLAMAGHPQAAADSRKL